MAAAPSAGDISPAATATEMSLTTRPTDGPRSWSRKIWCQVEAARSSAMRLVSGTLIFAVDSTTEGM